MAYAARADSATEKPLPAGKVTVACEESGPTDTSPEARRATVSGTVMSTKPPRRLAAEGAEGDLASLIDAKCVALNTEKKPSRWAALYMGTPLSDTRLWVLSLPWMCRPASNSAPVCTPGSAWA